MDSAWSGNPDELHRRGQHWHAQLADNRQDGWIQWSEFVAYVGADAGPVVHLQSLCADGERSSQRYVEDDDAKHHQRLEHLHDRRAERNQRRDVEWLGHADGNLHSPSERHRATALRRSDRYDEFL